MSSLLYIPIESLQREDIESLVKLCLNDDTDRVDLFGGRKVALKYLLKIHATDFDLSSYIDITQITRLEDHFNKLKQFDFFRREFDRTYDNKLESYWELESKSSKIDEKAKSARQFMNKEGFQPEQLKIYFNSKEIDNIPHTKVTFNTTGFVDGDARDYMSNYPIFERKNEGQINTKQGRVENVIFDIPPGKQVIVLDFADERMPGGFFLYGATTQEETICYNSDTYQALLDLKYNRFDGGFFIPEFGCLYIKHVQFFKPPAFKQRRIVDIVAAACYDLTGRHGLHETPHSAEAIEFNTKKKLETIIAAAQANTEGNGENTYLILGPIGCGAFKNKLESIAKLWAEVLLKPLDPNLNTQQRHAFQHIWFLSGTDQKLRVFERAFNLDTDQRL
ncbi:unnamed protein product [Adineta steineri]|uniref:Microbial-type PARG catalytic domain-containing protein n=1 Tax=Adineta steineri TaxID=433720 RepID=A0A815LGR7_9BILA|nr:unnamed protein product [Adineta steineri]CAF1617108.1 unnamed protein product [Adineta steineri]